MGMVESRREYIKSLPWACTNSSQVLSDLGKVYWECRAEEETVTYKADFTDIEIVFSVLF